MKTTLIRGQLIGAAIGGGIGLVFGVLFGVRGRRGAGKTDIRSY